MEIGGAKSGVKIIVVDGQGGGVGRMLVGKLKARLPGVRVVAVGTNALATSAMLRAGADAGTTGENAVLFNCRDADVLLGPDGIAFPDAMLGEVSPAMAAAVADSPAKKFLLPMHRCAPEARQNGAASMEDAVETLISEAFQWLSR